MCIDARALSPLFNNGNGKEWPESGKCVLSVFFRLKVSVRNEWGQNEKRIDGGTTDRQWNINANGKLPDAARLTAKNKDKQNRVDKMSRSIRRREHTEFEAKFLTGYQFQVEHVPENDMSAKRKPWCIKYQRQQKPKQKTNCKREKEREIAQNERERKDTEFIWNMQ